jgi:hypothetical protein
MISGSWTRRQPLCDHRGPDGTAPRLFSGSGAQDERRGFRIKGVSKALAGGHLWAFTLTNHWGHLQELFISPNAEIDGIARSEGRNNARKIVPPFERVSIHGGEYVTHLDSDTGRRTAGFRTIENCSVRGCHAETVCESSGHRLHSDTDPSAYGGSSMVTAWAGCKAAFQ